MPQSMCLVRVSFVLKTRMGERAEAKKFRFIEETLSEVAFKVCSSKNLFIKSYRKFIGKRPGRRIILEKVAKQT